MKALENLQMQQGYFLEYPKETLKGNFQNSKDT